MAEYFGKTPKGETAHLYTICSGPLTAVLSDFGATLVRLFVPDAKGNMDDVVLGFDSAAEYAGSDTFMGATVGRNANRIGGAAFVLGSKTYHLAANDGSNNLHSGPDSYAHRLWQVTQQGADFIEFFLRSPHMDQGFPGNADIRVTYRLQADSLSITYDAVSDRDTVFNMTNHGYFNLPGHHQPHRAMEQLLCMPARCFTPADSETIPTGECREIAGTPMDFRSPKPIGQDIDAAYEPLQLQQGYDHNFEVFCNPCAILSDPVSGRSMAVYTDCPGLQVYSGNYTNTIGKGGQSYPRRSGVCLEAQFYPDSLHNPHWTQSLVPAGQKYHSQTTYRFNW